MNSFFEQVALFDKFKDYYTVFDWLFYDKKFSRFDSKAKARLTKEFKRKLSQVIPTEDYECGTIAKFTTEAATNYKPKVQMSAGSSESETFIRHIRNGIAHGHAKLRIYSGEIYIRVIDYQKNETTQTADIVPLE